MTEEQLSPTSALIAHLEAAIDDQKILYVGCAYSSVAEQLLERGARLVHVLDPDPQRVTKAAAQNRNPKINYSQLSESGLRDGSYGLTIIEEVESLPAPQNLIAQAKRTISNQGFVVFTIRANPSDNALLSPERPGSNGSLMSWSDFSSQVSTAFQRSRFLAQSPFVGYGVVHLDLDAAPEPALDNGFLQGQPEPAEFYAAICGEREAFDELQLEEMTIAQLPALELLRTRKSQKTAAINEDRRRADELELEVQQLRRRTHPEELERLRAELEERNEQLRAAQATIERQKARAATNDVSFVSEGSSSNSHELRQLQERLDEAERVASRSQKETSWAEQRVKKIEQELEQVLREVDETSSGVSQNDYDQLRSKFNRAQAEKVALVDEHQALKAELKSVHQSLQAKEKIGEKAETAQKKLRAQVEKLSKENEELQKKLSSQEPSEDDKKRLKEQNAAIQDFKKSLADAEADADLYYRRYRDVEEELEESMQRLDASEEIIKKIKARASGASESQLRERDESIQRLEKDIARLESYAEGLIAQLKLHEKSITKNESLQKDAKQKSKHADAASWEELQTLRQQLAETAADLEESRWTIGQLRQEAISGSI
ncbi:MAG: hypothetical protein MK135_06990 [Polyangiaceae bacterium]|nr:hypothetical protein [Polyangiaceae bacterium]